MTMKRVTPDQLPAEEEKLKEAAREAGREQAKQMWGEMAKHKKFPRLLYLLEQNFERSEANRARGMEFNDLSLLQHRIESAIEFMLPMGTEDRLEYELDWQERISKSLDTMDKEYKAQRTAAAQPKLFIPR